MGILERVKTAMRTWLEIEPGTDSGAIKIDSALSFDAQVLRNRIWYRGDPSEIEQFFKAAGTDTVTESLFWASVPALPIRKMHLDIPTQVVDRLAGVVASDFTGFEIKDKESEKVWEEIANDNRWNELSHDSIGEALVTGDGAYKMTIDPSVSEYPIIEFYGADRATPVHKRGRLQEIVFHTLYSKDSRRYRLDEHYGNGYILSQLYDISVKNDREVPLGALAETAGLLPEVKFTGKMLAVPLRFFKSPMWPNRGASILQTKSSAYDALDEVISEWWDDYRKGRVKQFLPEDMFPRDPNTGKILRPNAFDDIFVKISPSLAEGDNNGMSTFSPSLRAEAYMTGYAQALDMSLQGIVSPATLGIDLKKTDNAEAQREKEKTTLWTRAKIVDALTEAWPLLVQTALAAYDNMKKRNPREVEVEVTFGEYSSPSFDQQLESMAVAAQWNLVSIEQQVDELYGDTKDDEWKATEVSRIKELRGIATVAEPAPGSPPMAPKPITKIEEPEDGSV